MNHAALYFTVFAASLAVDLIPFLGPPAWMAMVFFLTKYDLNPWLVLAAGVPGSVLGRYVLSVFMPKISDRVMKKHKSEELKFVGSKLNGKLWHSWAFVFVYSLLPMSTTALFTAAGIARVSPLLIIPPFFLGKGISDAVILFSSHAIAMNLKTVEHSLLSPKSIALSLLGLAVLAAFLFLDWRTLLQKRKLAFNFRI